MEQNARLLRSKNEKLEKLCRALQAERNQLKKQDKPVRLVMLSSQLCLYTLDSTRPQPEGEGEEQRKKGEASAGEEEEEDSGPNTAESASGSDCLKTKNGTSHADASVGVATAVENGKENSGD